MIVFITAIITVIVGLVLGIVTVLFGSAGFSFGSSAIGFSIILLVVVILGNALYGCVISSEAEDLIEARAELVEAFEDSPDNKYIQKKVVEFNDAVIGSRISVNKYTWAFIAKNKFNDIKQIDM